MLPRFSRSGVPQTVLAGPRTPRSWIPGLALLAAVAVGWLASADDAAAQRMLRGAGESAPAALQQIPSAAPQARPAARPPVEITVRTGGEPVAAPPVTRPDRKAPTRRVTTFPGSPRPNTAPAPKITPPNAVAWQAALDRAGFSPGLIDGAMGRKTEIALRAFQESVGLPKTGVPDEATAQALGVADQPAVRYTVLTANDELNVGPSPTNWGAKSRLRGLKFRSLADLVAERGHCSQALLAGLNPGVDLRKLRAGNRVLIPNVTMPRTLPQAGLLEIDYGAKTISAFDSAGRRIALFHCSIARNKDKRLTGSSRIVKIVPNPQYDFNPAMWPEVKGINRKLVIPPGPRNPVGVCWLGLASRGYGIHGTPEPENIGKTGSHGCFRLTNWNVSRLALMVRIGTPVRFVDSSARGR